MKSSPYKNQGISEFQLYLKYNSFTIGLSNANRWWGPGIHTSLSMSNNTAGFNHYFLGINDLFIKKIEKLKKKDTLGGINFDSVIISDCNEGLKSIATSLLYTDVSPQRIYYITLNQWFDKTFFNENAMQNLYFPSIDYKNLNKFSKMYCKNPGT